MRKKFTGSRKVGILTYHYIANNGAALFAYSLCNALREHLPEFDIELVNYQSREMRWNEILKQLKLYSKIPFFNVQRRRNFNKFIADELCVDYRHPLITDNDTAVKLLSSQDYHAIITAMDVWNIVNIRSLPNFPNIYWIPNPIRAIKIAYAVSCYRSQDELLMENITTAKFLVDEFDLVGVRDEYTYDIVHNSPFRDTVPLTLVPDPTFMYEIKETGVRDVLSKQGVDLSKPILGLLMYGKLELSKKIRLHYKAAGYQIVALSMYNQYADINLGHILNPHQWAEAFRYFSFCITDRFHGAIFCLKHNIPFITIEPDAFLSHKQSKLYSLLKSFDILDCYVDIYAENFRPTNIFDTGNRLITDWKTDYESKVEKKLIEMGRRNMEFIRQIQGILHG